MSILILDFDSLILCKSLPYILITNFGYKWPVTRLTFKSEDWNDDFNKKFVENNSNFWLVVRKLLKS